MRILVVEDDQMLGLSLVRGLEQEGYATQWSREVEDAIYKTQTGPFDAVVLDLSLPGGDGLSVLRSMRRAFDHTPVVIISARDRLQQRIEGLDAGADDYLVKPFDLKELLARLRVQIRRVDQRIDSMLQIGKVQLNLETRTVTVLGERINLAARELKLLSLLMRRADRFVSKADIVAAIYEDQVELGSNTVESAIYALRKLFGTEFIVTARGLGYMVRS